MVNDSRLSFRARGVLLWLLDKPDDWRCSGEEIARAGSEGRDAVLTTLRELEGFGYLRREKMRDATNGRIVTITSVYEKPPGIGFPGPGNPPAGNPAPGDLGPFTNTDVPKTDTETPSVAEATESFAPKVEARRQLEKETVEIVNAYWEFVKRETGKGPVGISHIALRNVIRPFVDAGYTRGEIKSAMKAVRETGRTFTRQVFEQHLDGRIEERRRKERRGAPSVGDVHNLADEWLAKNAADGNLIDADSSLVDVPCHSSEAS